VVERQPEALRVGGSTPSQATILESSMQKPSIGRVAHFVSVSGHHHAAVITEVAYNHPLNAVSLFVMSPDGLSVQLDTPYSETHVPGTWHFPERVE
jgi:hypothetical protein